MSNRQLLIVEDDADLANAMRIRLQAYGYQVAIAVDAIDAIGKARKVHPALIVLDIGLPAGDGFTVMERLRSLEPPVTAPIIVVSARDPSNRERALDAGAIAYLQKPVNNLELLAAIEEALQE